MKKKKFGLFAGKKAGARRREEAGRFKDYRDSYYEDDDFNDDFEDEYDRDDYDDRDYAEDDDYYSEDYDDVDRNYRDEDARYEDERDYRDDNRYADEDDRYEDEEDDRYADDERYEDEYGDRYADDERYEDEDGERYADDDYYEDEDRYEDDVDDRYADEEDDRYEDEEDDADYREDDRYEDEEGDADYRENDRYEDEEDDADYREDDRYEDEEDDRYEDADVDYAEDDRYEDEDARYDDERDYGEDDVDYREDDRYEDEEDDRYEDDDRYADDEERYADDDDRYADDEERYADEDDRYEDDYDDRYADDYDDYEYDRYDDDDRYASDLARGNKSAAFAGKASKSKALKSAKKSAKKSRKDSRRKNKKERDDRDSVFARFLTFVKGTSAVERTAAAVGIVILAGVIVTMSFFSTVMGRNHEISSFADVGSNMGNGEVVGQSGLIAVADAEKAKSMAAEMVESPEEEEEEEEDVEDVEIKMNLTTIKSDMKIKFVSAKTNKLVASVPFKVDVTTPDGSKISYEDDDKDGIIYKKELKAGKYTVTPVALSGDYAKYKLDTSSKTLNVKDTVEMKAVDVSNEIKKESQVNAAKEDTAVQTQVESVLKDTVEWVESTKTPVGDGEGEGDYTYEEIDNNNIKNPIAFSRNFAPGTFVKTALFTGAGTDATLPPTTGDDNSNTDNTGDKTETPKEKTDEEKAAEEKAEQERLAKEKEEQEKAEQERLAKEKEEQEKAEKEKAEQERLAKEKEEKEKAEKEKAEKERLEKEKADKEKADKEKADAELKAKPIVPSPNLNGKEMKVGEKSAEIKATNANGESIPVKLVARNDVAKIEGNCIVAVKEGKALVDVTSEGYKTPYSFNIQVKAAPLKKMKLSVENGIKLKVGSVTNAITAVDEADGKTAVNIKAITIRNEDKNVLELVDGNKIKVKAKGSGKAFADVTADGYTTYSLTIYIEGTGGKIPLKVSNMTLMEGKKVSPAVSELVKDDNIKKIKLTSDNTKIVQIEGDASIVPVAKGVANVTVTADGYEASDKIKITVLGKKDPLTDKDGKPLYMKNSDGKFVEATLADYDPNKKFYTRKAGKQEYKYTGWQTIDGKTYFFKKDHEYVTGEQVIQGAKYTFGADGVLASGSGSRGIDVSKWNGSIDWNKVKNEGIDFAIIRCGYRGSSAGALIEDPTFRTNMKGAQAAGIKVGVYFFTQAVNEVEAVEEASMVINLCKGYGLTYPVYLDVEGSNGRGDSISAAQRTANIKAFCGTIQNAGYKAGVYANKTWFTSKINTSQLTNYKIWLAQYAAAPTYNATRYDMWQYTSKGKVSGISGNVDMNTWYR
ncbi:MAG: glycoside hydrolase family 25 protein [Butyrivibrio sp.]|nr:glycoside hydrolase family 25 protein [Butyrivibrio sp.]